MLPTFLHIGAGKCKSTWLYRVCLEHPDIYVPGQGYDNVNFFVNQYQRGLPYYEEKWFSDYRGEKVAGEFSNSYMAFEPALQRIAKHLPDVKLTMTIMNPVHRIFYSWAHVHIKTKCRMTLFGETRAVSRVEVEDLLERCGMDPAQGVLPLPERLTHHHGHSFFRTYADSCLYAFCIDRIRRYFPADRLKVMLYEDLLADQAAFLRDFFQFVGADDSFTSTLAPEEVNPDPPLLEYERWFPPELRAQLVAEFRDDIEALQDLLDRDLSAWLDDSTTYDAEYCRRWR